MKLLKDDDDDDDDDNNKLIFVPKPVYGEGDVTVLWNQSSTHRQRSYSK